MKARPMNLDEQTVLLSLYWVAVDEVAGGREGLVELEAIREATASRFGRRRPLGRDKTRAILRELVRAFSHDAGPALAAERLTDQPLAFRRARRGQPVRWRLSERGIAKARELVDRRARAQARAEARAAADRQGLIDTGTAAR